MLNSNVAARPIPEFANALAAASGESIVIALRVDELERIAWCDGRGPALALERRLRDAFARVCRRTLRRGDIIAHEAGSNLFLAALRESERPADVARVGRVVLAAIQRQFADLTGIEPAGGWTLYRRLADPEQALRAAADAALERGRRERERYAFFAALGHEMRTPLTSIDGYLTALVENGIDDPVLRRRFAEIAQLEAGRLRRMVESMYALALIDLDADIVREATCDVQKAVESACDAIFPMAARRGVRIRVCSRIDDAISMAEEHAVQTFLNLLENAVKHGRENGRIEIYLEATPGGVTLCFDDDGPGIAALERTTIFEPRVRGKTTTAVGHGLGLSIARAAIERAGGSIEAGAATLGGARFIVQLPRSRVVPPATAGAVD